jgi:hypothetical protein
MSYSLAQVRAFAKKSGYVLDRAPGGSGGYVLETREGRFIADVLGAPGAGYSAFTSYPHGVLNIAEEAQEAAERAAVCHGMRQLFA